MEDNKFAVELLSEVRSAAKRWFLAFVVMVGLEFATIVGFVWYISLPVETEDVAIENQDGNANYVGNDMNGDLYNGKDNGEADETSSTSANNQQSETQEEINAAQ